MLRFVLLLALACSTSCSSVEWLERPAGYPETWRDLRVFYGENATILARDADAAAEVCLRVDEVVATIREHENRGPGRGVVIAVSFEDEPLIEGPEELGRAVARWRGLEGGASLRMPESGPMGPIEIDPALPARLLMGPLPLEDNDIELPDAIVRDADWGFLTPSDSCVREVADRMFEIAADQQQISMFMRGVLWAIMDPVERIGEVYFEQVRSSLFDVCTGPMDLTPEQVLALVKHAGLVPEDAELVEPQEASESVSPWVYMHTLAYLPEYDQGATPHPQLIVDVRAEPHDASGLERLRRVGVACVSLPIDTELPTAEHAHRLEQLFVEHGRIPTWIYAPDLKDAAAVLASHAFYVRGWDTEEALAVTPFPRPEDMAALRASFQQAR